MNNNRIKKYIGFCLLCLVFTSCSVPKLISKSEDKSLPERYQNTSDTTNTAQINWKAFFTDPYLIALIDTALVNNQELNITLQEISIAKNEIRARKGEYLPFVNIGAAASLDKVGRYTRLGALEATTDIEPGRDFPEPLPDFLLGASASWEVDIWHKLRNAKKSATFRYLSTVEGKNFMVTNLVAEIANSYFELLALDNQLSIIQENIEIQKKALEIVRLQKQAARVTELAVRKFEAEVLKNRSLQFFYQQKITETENKINFLIGQFPQPVLRSSQKFTDMMPKKLAEGVPSQLLQNRPDILQSELELSAAKLDVSVAKAQFYPSLDITAGLGLNAFNTKFILKSPESLLYSLAGELMGPLINRNAIKANYFNANSKQIQAVFNYQRTVLNAYVEVANQLANIENLEKSYDLQSQQVEALTESISISTNLFKSARANYIEVLLTQRDALESKIELIETKKMQMNAFVNMYQALGGGWKQQ